MITKLMLYHTVVGILIFGTGVLFGTVNTRGSSKKWRTRWIKLEHGSARALGREPREISMFDNIDLEGTVMAYEEITNDEFGDILEISSIRRIDGGEGNCPRCNSTLKLERYSWTELICEQNIKCGYTTTKEMYAKTHVRTKAKPVPMPLTPLTVAPSKIDLSKLEPSKLSQKIEPSKLVQSNPTPLPKFKLVLEQPKYPKPPPKPKPQLSSLRAEDGGKGNCPRCNSTLKTDPDNSDRLKCLNYPKCTFSVNKETYARTIR